MDAEPITTQKQPCALILINSFFSFEGYFDNDIRLLANAIQLNNFTYYLLLSLLLSLSIDYSVVVHNIISWYCIVQYSIVYRLLLPLFNYCYHCHYYCYYYCILLLWFIIINIIFLLFADIVGIVQYSLVQYIDCYYHLLL